MKRWKSGFETGMILQERYELQELIGTGGSARVFRGWDQRLERQCAIKIMTFHDLQQVGSCLRQLYREAELLKELRHPAIPAILDILEMTWQSGTEEGYALGLVMEMAEGLSLEDYILGKKTYSLQDLLDWATQVCDALIYLHDQSPPVIYRDMKPGHVIIDDQGMVHLIDFGIARQYLQGRKRDTELLGTRGYAAPEQYGSGQTDCRTDIFGMGMTLWEALENWDQNVGLPGDASGGKIKVNAVPGGKIRADAVPGGKIKADTVPGEKIRANVIPDGRNESNVLSGKKDPLALKNKRRENCGVYSDNNEAFYKKLRRIFCKCTAIDPKDRYQSCQEVKADLIRCGSGRARSLYFIKNFTIHKEYVLAGILIILFFAFSGNIIVCGNAEFQKEIRYSQLIHFSESQSTKEKIENCKAAIRLDGSNLQAYMQLLDLYESSQCFDQGESAAFTGLIEENRGQLQDQDAFPELILRTGEMYIYLYNEEVDFQEKLFLAYPWFQEVRDRWPEAEGFARLAVFEKSYVVQGVMITQPESKDYAELLNAIRLCMEYLKEEGYQDSLAYSRLIIWDELSRLLYSQTEGMLISGITGKEICQLMEELGESAGQEEVTRSDCLDLQEKIQTNVKIYLERISAKAEAGIGE